LIKGENLDYN